MGLETLLQGSNNRIVLMYHDLFLESPDESGFVSRGANHYKIESSLFEKHVKYIREQHLDSKVVFSFDDGGKSMYELAAPILEKNGLKGVFCVPTSYIDESNFLSKQQIIDLYKRGHIIATHSDTHPHNLSLLEGEQHHNEWSKSIRILSEILESPVKVASIPNGFYSQIDIDVLDSYGVTCVFTSFPTDKIKNKNTIVKGRYAITNRTTWRNFKLIINSPFYRYYLSVRQYSLDRLKKIVGFGAYSFIKRGLRLIWK